MKMYETDSFIPIVEMPTFSNVSVCMSLCKHSTKKRSCSLLSLLLHNRKNSMRMYIISKLHMGNFLLEKLGVSFLLILS